MDPLTVDLPETNTEGQENTPNPEEKKKLPWFPIVIILVTVLIIFVAAGRGEENEEADTDTTDGEGTNAEMTEEGDEAPQDLLATTELNATDFEGRDQAEYIINSTQGKIEGTDAYERIQSGIVEDGDIENTVYFSTSSFDKELNETFVGIYKYDTVTYRWHRLYKNTYKADGDVAASFFRVIAKQGTDLILFMDSLESEFDACDSYWVIGTDADNYDLYTLSIENSLDGPQAFEAPADLLETERANVTACNDGDEETIEMNEEDENEDEDEDNEIEESEEDEDEE
jgi:hypothetical protein